MDEPQCEAILCLQEAGFKRRPGTVRLDGRMNRFSRADLSDLS